MVLEWVFIFFSTVRGACGKYCERWLTSAELSIESVSRGTQGSRQLAECLFLLMDKLSAEATHPTIGSHGLGGIPQ